MIRSLLDRLIELDGLLRGDHTRPDGGAPALRDVSAAGLATAAAALAMFYGACMGSFSLFKTPSADIQQTLGPALQVLASIVKTPALFGMTLAVTLPSLYVASALAGSRLTLGDIARLLAAAVAVNVAVLASLGTIVLFFSVTTDNYPFIVLLNVAAFAVSGVLGLMFLLQTLHRLLGGETPTSGGARAATSDGPVAELTDDDPHDEPGPIDMPSGQALSRRTRLVFRCWLVLFALVGAQSGWVLRPFIGSPGQPFQLFRDRESNFFVAVADTLRAALFGGG